MSSPPIEPLTAIPVRALAVGSVVGAVTCMANLYVGLKTGIAFGVGVTACFAAFALDATMRRFLSTHWKPFQSAEFGLIVSVASAAGYSTGGTVISASAAFVLLQGEHMPMWPHLAWTLALAWLGVAMALPMRRQLIEVEQLPFPSATAAALMIRDRFDVAPGRTLHVAILAIATLCSGCLAILRDYAMRLPMAWLMPGSIRAFSWSQFSVGIDISGLYLGVGALMGLPLTLSMLVGSVGLVAVAAPLSLQVSATVDDAAALAANWGQWAGSGMLTVSGLWGLVAQGRPIARRFFQQNERKRDDGDADAGKGRLVAPFAFVLALAIVALGQLAFGISWMASTVALVLSWITAIVATRAAGSTDVTPSGPLSQLTQLTVARLFPGPAVSNLMASSIAGNTSAAAADVVADLKLGSMVGVRVTHQLKAQLWGCVVGAAVIVPLFERLVPDRSAIGPEGFSAPAAQVFANLASLLAEGSILGDRSIQLALGAGIVGGLMLEGLGAVVPKMTSRFVPSATGVGVALLLPPSTVVALVLGAVLGRSVQLRLIDSQATSAAAAGLIAGESFTAIAVALAK